MGFDSEMAAIRHELSQEGVVQPEMKGGLSLVLYRLDQICEALGDVRKALESLSKARDSERNPKRTPSQ